MADQLLAGIVDGEGNVLDTSLQVTMQPEVMEGPGNMLGALTVAQVQPWMGASITGEADILEAPLTVLTRTAPTSRVQNVKHGAKVTWEDF